MEVVGESMVEQEDPGHCCITKGTQEAEGNAVICTGDFSFTGQTIRASIWCVSSSCVLHD